MKITITRSHAVLFASGFALALLLSAAPVKSLLGTKVPNTFVTGTIASAEDVNANFSNLDGRIETLNDFVTSGAFDGVPTSTIVIWGGSIASIPAGWTLCDGTAGTPDLQDRFVVGAGSNYVTDETGGSESHAHLFTLTPNLETTDQARGDYVPSLGPHVTTSAYHLPPYYALAYIMKL